MQMHAPFLCVPSYTHLRVLYQSQIQHLIRELSSFLIRKRFFLYVGFFRILIEDTRRLNSPISARISFLAGLEVTVRLFHVRTSLRTQYLRMFI